LRRGAGRRSVHRRRARRLFDCAGKFSRRLQLLKTALHN
jgi:hypothetical protein